MDSPVQLERDLVVFDAFLALMLLLVPRPLPLAQFLDDLDLLVGLGQSPLLLPELLFLAGHPNLGGCDGLFHGADVRPAAPQRHNVRRTGGLDLPRLPESPNDAILARMNLLADPGDVALAIRHDTAGLVKPVPPHLQNGRETELESPGQNRQLLRAAALAGAVDRLVSVIRRVEVSRASSTIA